MAENRKHILILPKWYPNPSDLQLGIFIQNQAILVASNFKVTVLFVKGIVDCPEPFFTKVISHNGIKEVRVYFKKHSGLGKILNLKKYRKAQNIGLNLIDTPIDLVHVQVPIRPWFLAESLLKKKAIPYLVTEHWSGHLNNSFSQKPTLYKHYYKKALASAAAITAVSKPLAQKLVGLTNKEIDIIPNYIKASEKMSDNHASSSIEIVSVSDLNNETKNIIGLLEGFNAARKIKPKLHLSIVGDGPDKGLIVDKVIALALQNHVTLLGRKEQVEVLELLPSFDFYVCNSNVETFGMTVAEAILAGLPVICTRCGGPEQFVNNDNGVLIPTQNKKILQTTILEMADTFSKYNSLQNKNYIRGKFGKATVLNQWTDLYNAILSG